MSKLEEQLIESSRAIVDIIVANIGSDQKKFDEIMDMVYQNVYPLSMRAAWVAYLAYEKHPELAIPHIGRLIDILKHTKVDGIKRAGLKILCASMDNLSEEQFGNLTDIAFSFMESPKQAIAVRAFSIDIITKVTKVYPELIPEFVNILEAIIPDGSRGLQNKCRKLLKKLKKAQ